MSAKKKHYLQLPKWLQEYAQLNNIKYQKYSEYHMRIMDGGLVCFDAWTTGKYYVKETDYKLLNDTVIERSGETGTLHTQSKKKLYVQLNKIFYPLDFK